MGQSAEEAKTSEAKEIERLIERLSPNDPRRLGALAVLEGDGPPANIEALLEALHQPWSYGWRERAVAAWTLGKTQIPPEQRSGAVKALCDVLNDRQVSSHFRFQQSSRRAMYTSMLVGGGIGVLTVLLAVITHRGAETPLDLSLLLGSCMLGVTAAFFGTWFLMPIVWPVLVWQNNYRAALTRVSAADALGELAEPQAVGALAEAAQNLRPRIRRAALRALQRVLPTLTPEHYGTLDAQAVPHLCGLLTFADESVAVEVVEALGRAGDGRAVRQVSEVARVGRSARLREAAARALPILEERLRQENAPKILLRPAGAPASPADQLLRPARHTSETEPQQLLRASQSEP